MAPKEKVQLVLDKFKKNIKPKQFAFSQYVSEFDYENICGTVCCIAGWFPKLFPNSGFKWDEEYESIIHDSGKNIIDSLSNLLDINLRLVEYLFIGSYDIHDDAPQLNEYSSYEEVVAAWQWVLDNWDKIDTNVKKYELS